LVSYWISLIVLFGSSSPFPHHVDFSTTLGIKL
jgi:hypothetical protein